MSTNELVDKKPEVNWAEIRTVADAIRIVMALILEVDTQFGLDLLLDINRALQERLDRLVSGICI